MQTDLHLPVQEEGSSCWAASKLCKRQEETELVTHLVLLVPADKTTRKKKCRQLWPHTGRQAVKLKCHWSASGNTGPVAKQGQLGGELGCCFPQQTTGADWSSSCRPCTGWHAVAKHLLLKRRGNSDSPFCSSQTGLNVLFLGTFKQLRLIKTDPVHLHNHALSYGALNIFLELGGTHSLKSMSQNRVNFSKGAVVSDSLLLSRELLGFSNVALFHCFLTWCTLRESHNTNVVACTVSHNSVAFRST